MSKKLRTAEPQPIFTGSYKKKLYATTDTDHLLLEAVPVKIIKC